MLKRPGVVVLVMLVVVAGGAVVVVVVVAVCRCRKMWVVHSVPSPSM